jgi:hypothetical protein
MDARGRLPPRLTALVALAFGVQATTGCLSNEYSISKDELTRVVQLPPNARGERVKILQSLGERRNEPVPPSGPPAPWVGPRLPADPPPPVIVESEPAPQIYVEGDLDIPLPHGGGPRPAPPPVRGGSWRAPGRAPGGSGGGTGGNVAGKAGEAALKGGGSGKGEELAVLAVVVAAAAVFTAVGLAASEGARFDGYTQIRPEQPVHLKNAAGQELHVPLGALTSEEVAEATEAKVMDDEGYGLRLLDRRPLDRVGATFKVTLGPLFEPPAAGDPAQETLSGFSSTIQVGGYFTQGLGLVGSLSLGGGSDSAGHTFQRHGVGLELQALPLRVGPLALGGFGHGGLQMVGAGDDFTSGPALGGGVLLELALSTRLAFALRGDWTATNLQDRHGWIGNGSVTAGLSIY